MMQRGARYVLLGMLGLFAWAGSTLGQSVTLKLDKVVDNDTLKVAVMIKESGMTISVGGADILLGATIDLLYDPTALAYKYFPATITRDAIYEAFPRTYDSFGATYGPQVDSTSSLVLLPSRLPEPTDGDEADICNPPTGGCTPPAARITMDDQTASNGLFFITDEYQTVLTQHFLILPTTGSVGTLRKTAVNPIDVAVDSSSLAICFVDVFSSLTSQCCKGADAGSEVAGFCNIDNPVLLPVELSDFSAVVDNGDVVLNWETASETNNAGFSVEHAAGANGTFEEVAYVDGAGTSLEPKFYTYTVKGLDVGTHRFRLKQLDYDGAFKYSQVVETTIELAGTHRLGAAYPNPFNPSTTFELVVGRDQRVRIDIINALGQRVQRMFDGNLEANKPTNFTFQAGTLPTGLYFYRVVGENFAQTRQVLLVK